MPAGSGFEPLLCQLWGKFSKLSELRLEFFFNLSRGKLREKVMKSTNNFNEYEMVNLPIFHKNNVKTLFCP